MNRPDNQSALPAEAETRPVENSDQSEFLIACLRAASIMSFIESEICT
jgi:hypothetical protein